MNHLELVHQVLNDEAEAIVLAANSIKQDQLIKMTEVFDFLTQSGGALVLSGIGKSGIIAQKISSTFSSLGLKSFFLHPTEALHGDLGRMSKNDAIIVISKSGSTEEILKLFPFLPIPKERIIGLLGKLDSPLGEKCEVIFDCGVIKEACLNDLAPTTSTTVTLSMGDALAVLFESHYGVSREKFAINHPAGFLGKSLTLKVSEVMIPLSACPVLSTQSTLQNAILEMTQKPVGLCAIVEKNQFQGIIVEGDIRRAFAKNQNALTCKLEDIYNPKPMTIKSDVLVVEALKIIEGSLKNISLLPVVDNDNFVGVLKMEDVFKLGFSLAPRKSL